MTARRRGERIARLEATFFGAVVSATDLLPPRVRYGYVHPVTARLFRRPLATLAQVRTRPTAPVVPAPTDTETPTLRCALLTGAIDIGGIGSVVELLATALPGAGMATVVVCTEDGARAAALRSRGIDVVVAPTEADAARALRETAPDVIQLHGAPEPLEAAALESGIPSIPVLHNTEIHYSRARWRRFARVLDAAPLAIAVSESVRGFHAAHVDPEPAARIVVVPNAAPSEAAPDAAERRAARIALAGALGADLGDDVVVVSLTRYDAQKNVAGLVSSFLAAVGDERLRLVVAGEPSDWAELRRADAIRRSSSRADRVSILGRSDARTLLAAADGFVLDSFFEGWPVAATEAAAAGLGLVLADFGGARELVARDVSHSVLVPNPCGAPEAVSDAVVARARRHCRHQPNATELGAALDAVAERARAGSRPRPPAAEALLAAMVDGHAAALRRASARRVDSMGGPR